MKKSLLLCLLTILLNGCIFLPEMPQRKPGEEQRYLIEGQKAFDDKAYPEAIKLFQGYLDKYPESQESSIVLQRLGESFEGLLEMEYQRRIKNSEPEPLVRKQFLEKYGSYNCWETTLPVLPITAASTRCCLKSILTAPLPMRLPTA